MSSSFFAARALEMPSSRPRRGRALLNNPALTLLAKLKGLLPGFLCLAGLAACTWISFNLDQGFAFTGFLCVVPVVLAAMYGGFWQATLVSVAAVASLDYFFIPPIFSFANSPSNWVALGAFEFTALVISRLSLRAQLRAIEAVAERRDMERLYETSRRILLLDRSREPGLQLTSLIYEIFDLRGVVLVDDNSRNIYQSGDVPPDVEGRTRRAFGGEADVFDPDSRTWYCVLRIAERPAGGLALVTTSVNRLAATALASLCGIALERALALERESHALAARQTEQLRTAVLDALAHQFKTPLTIARTASSGLLALGGLSELQAELVADIDEQATLLDQLATRLLGAGMLDSAEFQPRRESLILSRVIRAAILETTPATDRDRFEMTIAGHEIPVYADRELIRTALVQLVDNAIKYSNPGSMIGITLTSGADSVVLTLRTQGPIVTPPDCEHIFERFYRAPVTHGLPSGTGLGLSIVRKIVEAHQGMAWAEGEVDGTSFSIALPLASL